MQREFDAIVVGAGAAGMIASIALARAKKSVLLLEKLGSIGAKLKATGGGKCNLTNTLEPEIFIAKFGKNGRFIQDALKCLSQKDLIDFFGSIGVATHAPDGFRIFPTSHDANTILHAFARELERCGVVLACGEKVEQILQKEGHFRVQSSKNSYKSTTLILATGGLGYPSLGAEGDGHKIAASLGHTITKLAPAMMPLHTKERWVERCRSDTIPKARLQVALPKHQKILACGDLIFTKKGIRGPVVLDFAREITPLLEKYSEVPITASLTKFDNAHAVLEHLKSQQLKTPHANLVELLCTLLPESVALEFCGMIEAAPHAKIKELNGAQKELLYTIVAKTPLHINGHDGFAQAMITRGGISLKEIDPKRMQSRLIPNLYFCGEIVDIDGPCGGYNLQWSFSSGYLAGVSAYDFLEKSGAM